MEVEVADVQPVVLLMMESRSPCQLNHIDVERLRDVREPEVSQAPDARDLLGILA